MRNAQVMSEGSIVVLIGGTPPDTTFTSKGKKCVGGKNKVFLTAQTCVNVTETETKNCFYTENS
jgi:hypothetical protein